MTRPLDDRPGRASEPSEIFCHERQRLWALAYRITASSADADDVVQEAFLRWTARAGEEALATPAAWLWRVVTNEALDVLRRRRRRRYAGPWLPVPVEPRAGDDVDEGAGRGGDPATRYELLESASFAFLVALERLGPRQRAALLLRDVFGHSAEETGAILGLSAGHVRVLHLRARRALEDYDRDPCRPTAALFERHRQALERFLACLRTDDGKGLEELLCEDVSTLTDAGGEFTALTRPLAGRSAVARLYLAAAAHRREGGTIERFTVVNGLPAVSITLRKPVRRQAPRSLLRCELAADGRIRVLHAILASQKLARLGSP